MKDGLISIRELEDFLRERYLQFTGFLELKIFKKSKVNSAYSSKAAFGSASN